MLGVAPLSVELDPKKATALKVVKKGFEDGEITVSADMDPSVSVTLKRVRAKQPATKAPAKAAPKGGGKGGSKGGAKSNDYKPF